ncbi:MAG: AMP-dependent synthetase/ligase [Candidatus Woesearchaeota archaeon]
METLQDLVASLEGKDGVALSSKHGGWTYPELYRDVVSFSGSFLAMGYTPGDRVAVVADNPVGWLPVSLGLSNAGLVDVPLPTGTPRKELEVILEHSGARSVVAEKPGLVEGLGVDVIPFSEESFESLRTGSSQPLPEVSPGDTASIIYTSGTTGAPKGVELSHGNFMSNCVACLDFMDLDENDKFLSILPAWHAFERMAKYVALASGAGTFYTTQRDIFTDLKEQQPTIMASVPRIWRRVYDSAHDKLQKKLDGSSFARLAFKLAPGMVYKRMGKELHEALGGRFRYAISGGSRLSLDVDEFFRRVGIEVLEGYGLTETSPVVTGRRPGSFAVGTAGPPLKDVEVEVRDPESGEPLGPGEQGLIYVSGPNVMKGYHKNLEATEKAFSYDGGKRWLDTGDLGSLDEHGRLSVTARQKEIIPLQNGENVNPNRIEDALLKSPYVRQAFVTGSDEWKAPGVLLVPDYDRVKEYCRSHGVAFKDGDDASLASNPAVEKLFSRELKAYVNHGNGFRPHELVRRWHFLEKPFEVGEELTRTLKLKRDAIVEKYRGLIDDLYERVHGHRNA